MKALLLKDYKQLEVTNMPDPEIGPEEILVQVKACGICGSDVHGYDGHTGRRIPPLIMGHEASGVVAQTGGSVKQFSKGDRVTFHGKTKAVVANPDTIVVAAAPEFLEVGYLPEILCLFYQLYQRPDPCQQVLVLDRPQILNEALFELDGH